MRSAHPNDSLSSTVNGLPDRGSFTHAAGSRTGARRELGDEDMHARLARLEADMEYVKRDVGELRTDVKGLVSDMSALKERVSHLPTTGFTVSAVLISLALIAALITFQEQVQQFVRASGA